MRLCVCVCVRSFVELTRGVHEQFYATPLVSLSRRFPLFYANNFTKKKRKKREKEEERMKGRNAHSGTRRTSRVRPTSYGFLFHTRHFVHV